MREEYQDLLQHEIDGLNSTEQSERLEQLIASDSTIRQTFDELSAVQVAFKLAYGKDTSTDIAGVDYELAAQGGGADACDRNSRLGVAIFAGIDFSTEATFPCVCLFCWDSGLFYSLERRGPTEGGSIEPGLVGTMAPAGSPIIYENNISDNASLGTIYVTSRNGLVRVEIRWAGEQSAKAIVKFDPEILYATGVESVMGESSLSSLTRSEASLEYVTVKSSIDITTLVFVEGGETSGVPVVDVWISSDGLTTNKHRIPVNASK